MSASRGAWLIVFVFLPFSFFISARVAKAQETEAKVVLEPGLPGDPFQVVGLTEGTEAVTLSVPFSAGDDWLRNLSITFKNTSPKPITRVELVVKFLDPVAANLSSTTELGKRPANALLSLNGQPIPQTSGPPLVVEPGKTYTMPVIGDYGTLEAQIAQHQLPMWAMRNIQITFSFYYGDSTRWFHGYAAPGSTVGHWVLITPQQFKDYQPSGTD
jgi:hypothetical protein